MKAAEWKRDTVGPPFGGLARWLVQYASLEITVFSRAHEEMDGEDSQVILWPLTYAAWHAHLHRHIMHLHTKTF